MVNDEIPRDLLRGIEAQIKAYKSTKDIGFLIQHVYRFRNKLSAIYEQKKIFRYFFKDVDTIDKISYISPYADAGWSNCEPIIQGYYCAVLYRYDEIIVVTTFSYDNTLSGSKIDQILETFDNNVNKLLK